MVNPSWTVSPIKDVFIRCQICCCWLAVGICRFIKLYLKVATAGKLFGAAENIRVMEPVGYSMDEPNTTPVPATGKPPCPSSWIVALDPPVPIEIDNDPGTTNVSRATNMAVIE